MQLIALSQIIQNVKSKNFFLVDKKLIALYPELSAMLVGKKTFYTEEPEKNKNLRDYQKAVEYFLSENISREDILIVIGGGATSDLGGFVAATILRGIAWEVVPTTLLAMIDASIGGKVGVNAEFGKNLIGNFHLPSKVYISQEFLSSLPKEELISGQGELVKYAFLVKDVYQGILAGKKLSELIIICADYKQTIITDDLKDQGLRKQFNLGHTYGHAIEKCIGIPHGLAVIIGLKLIIDIYQPKLEKQFNELLKTFDFNFDIPRIDFENFKSYLKNDKKSNSKGEIEVIIPTEIGSYTSEFIKYDLLINDIKNYQYYETFFK